jgi:hypothetical protein
MKKILFAIAISVFVLFTGATSANATDFSVDCGDSGCTKSGTEPLFSKGIDGYWFPGRTLTKTINFKNSSSATKEMSIKPDRTSSVTILENAMLVSIVTNPGGTVVWAGDLAAFYSQTAISMGIFSSGANQDYKINASMNSAADNSYQSLESVFDLTLGFWETAPALTPTPTPSGGGGGTVAGASTGGASAPVCSDAAPAGSPTLTSATAGPNSVTLTWTEGPGPLTYYLVAYGTSGGSYSYGNPNIGGAGTTSYTVNNLSGGTPYYFVVRAGNGCKPGPFSNELSVTPGGGLFAGPAAGFAPGVLGVATPSSVLGTENAVKGVTKTCGNCIWWPFLLLELILLLVYSYITTRTFTTRVRIAVSIIVPVLTYIFFILWNRNCPESPWFFCKYFIYIDAGLFGLATLLWQKLFGGQRRV